MDQEHCEEILSYSGSKWDRKTFSGRLRYFAAITDTRKAFATSSALENAKAVVEKNRDVGPNSQIHPDAYWHAKHLYDSAFHPDTGDKMNIFGRMSFQVTGGMLLTGGLLHFYKTPTQVIFGQWFNQSFNALVNYTNRNAASSITTKQMGIAYVSATSAALAVALGLKRGFQRAPPIVARWVPFAAVASANMVNIPMTRQSELQNGVVVYDQNHNPVGKSKNAAKKGISQVVISRIIMAAPGMTIVPIIMERLLKRNSLFAKATWFHLPFQTLAVGASLCIMVPVGCALFPQTCTLLISELEKDLQESIAAKYGNSIKTVHFNKGL